MKPSGLILALVGATVLLSALVASASARNFSASEQRQQILWTRLNFAGGIGGTIECEVLLSGSLHTRTIAKVINSLIGYITEGTVLRCIRGNATIRQESFPWHRRYAGFTGTLPNISSIAETITGFEWTFREPGGITCTVVNATYRTTNSLTSRAVSRAEFSGRGRCGSFFEATFSGSETNVVNNLINRSRITVTLI